jgi:UDP-N-acetylglucosamine--N-acetylmuramyl-(pentapeptide) pyrophosphoryl-undecaprenol N-acetylglucosamine transferase
MELVRAGAARILEEKDLTPQALIDLIRDMTADPAQLETLGKNAAGLAVRDANDRIIREILSLTEG